ncbi:hypothetical protein B0H16DRAFT_1716182 [Mycena metata]|uniref:Uncharacterized protein n=1 Tax=Mycena metata TaxID=1033252 RepID=A0AAD7JT72_9AGAR|nr:hypothetical protein B0H16DRAFT_1716182 [Mycena metata]
MATNPTTNPATADVPRLTRVPTVPVAAPTPVVKKSKKHKSKKSLAVVEETPEFPEETTESPSSSYTSQEMSTDLGNLGLYSFFSDRAADDPTNDMDIDGSSVGPDPSVDDLFEPSPTDFIDPTASFNSSEDTSFSRGPALRAAEDFLATLGMQVNVPDPRWPVGMTAPLSPEAAAAIAQAERGGMPVGATMAIHPVLQALTVRVGRGYG